MKYLGIGLLMGITFLLGVHVGPMIPSAAFAQRQPETKEVTRSAPRASVVT